MVGTAGEAADVKRTMPKATNGVFVRILVFYIGATFVMFAIWPWDQLSGVGSSFVRVFSEIGIPAAASIINFVVITASISGINSGIYIFSRHTCTTWPCRGARQGSSPKCRDARCRTRRY